MISAFEKYIDTQTGDLRSLISRHTDENMKWRMEFEDLNTKKIIEIHNALKLLNVNIGNHDVEEARRRLTLVTEAFERDGSRVTENLDFATA